MLPMWEKCVREIHMRKSGNKVGVESLNGRGCFGCRFSLGELRDCFHNASLVSEALVEFEEMGRKWISLFNFKGKLEVILTHCHVVRYVKFVDSFAKLQLVPQSELSRGNIAAK